MSRRIWTPDCNGLADAGWKVATADGTVALTLCEAKRGRYLASRHSQAAVPTSDMPREIAKARLALRSAAVADAWIGDVKEVGDLTVNRREPLSRPGSLGSVVASRSPAAGLRLPMVALRRKPLYRARSSSSPVATVSFAIDTGEAAIALSRSRARPTIWSAAIHKSSDFSGSPSTACTSTILAVILR